MLGERLYELRRKKNMSQEEMAEKLNVSRQTISKWETNQTQPDFDKIIPICQLFDISSEELLTGKKTSQNPVKLEDNKRKTALVVSLSVFLYFVAFIWAVIAESLPFVGENLLGSIFLLICSIPTCFLIFYFVSVSKDKKEEKKESEDYKKYDEVVSLGFTILYLVMSFITHAWHLTWILWVVYALVIEIIHILLKMKEEK
ncbi:MAG: helix-turn-helix transcriptional regulator [Bacilli bacterium]|nr:helix-turn-helix transcriptional regulator [Bacilli bacterium]